MRNLTKTAAPSQWNLSTNPVSFQLICGLIFTIVWVVILLATSGICSAQESVDKTASMPTKYSAFFEKYCYECHDTDSQEGSVDLESLPFEISQDIETAERWSKILNAINSGEMPPEDSTPIADNTKLKFLDALSNEMVLARKILSDSGGVNTLRRLNRREYQNTMEALTGIRPNISRLPDDQANEGFDTTGASLFISSDQLELYLAVARDTLRLAFSKNKSSKTVRVEPEKRFTPHYRKVVKELRDKKSKAEAYLAQSSKPPSAFGILDEYQAKKQLAQSLEWLPQVEEYVARPETKTGAALILTIKHGGPTRVKLPTLRGGDYGKYKIRMRAAAYKDAPERFQYVEFTSGFGKGRHHLGWRKVNATLRNPEIIEFSFEHRPGETLNYMIHQRTHQDRGDKDLWTDDMRKNGVGTPPGVWVDWAELIGPEPTDTKVANSIMPTAPKSWSEKKYATEVLRHFAKKAFRGHSPSKAYIDKLLQHYADQRAKKMSVKDSMIEPLAIILSSPSFLYMVQSKAEGESDDPLSDSELAVRLSYFLWSTAPDKELMKLAKSGKLSDPDTLRKQTARMLADKRSSRFVQGFTHQWLEMERIDMFQFNGRDFPTFDNAVRANAREEIFSTISLMLKKRLPLKTLLKSNFAVVNDLMAGYYGLPEVKGHEFRKVSLPKNSIRGGLLGMAAIYCMGSDGVRSSPVERGAWVLRHLLNNPPPPAPPNVPQLSRLAGEPLTAKKLQRSHQEQPQCAQCHQKIDPIGFGLENFDASGKWREQETVQFKVNTQRKNKKGKLKKAKTKIVKFKVDPSGKFPGGPKFSNFLELRDEIAKHEDSFARGFTEALIEYGLGRPYGFTDQDLADEILKSTKKSDYDIGASIHALIQSKPFQAR